MNKNNTQQDKRPGFISQTNSGIVDESYIFLSRVEPMTLQVYEKRISTLKIAMPSTPPKNKTKQKQKKNPNNPPPLKKKKTWHAYDNQQDTQQRSDALPLR